VIDRRRFLKALGLGSVAAALSVVSRGEPKRPGRWAQANPASAGRPQTAGPSTAVAPVAVPSGSSVMRFRGEGGVILASVDGGATWTRHSHLGPAYHVTRRVQTSRKGDVTAKVGYAGRSFKLRLTEDERAWRTV
jgi:hypothetical protein